jgi:hypothetical protein
MCEQDVIRSILLILSFRENCMAKRRTRAEFNEVLDTLWLKYPKRLRRLSKAEQVSFAQQQGYASPQDLLAHLGAWMEETLRVMPYLRRDERPPRTYRSDAEFNAHAVQRFADRSRAEVEAWYEEQRSALKHLIEQLSDEDFSQPRVYRWLNGTIVSHYDEHPLPR